MFTWALTTASTVANTGSEITATNYASVDKPQENPNTQWMEAKQGVKEEALW